ncbi:hypothetical protein FD754_022915 [Muntiacus muntjak]|uniref:Prefoldin subunit 6 n=1 Tax=Muntiacus muntjak TaxID=9888 RepID=A0A5N3UW24_MUNMU|nr:hypothetical protein FD754_022915 [Muntiacus muntjak]
MAELIQKKFKSMSGRQKLEAQLTENNIMKEEMALLDGSNVVFKLLGHVLVKQELGEARATVGKNLDYITAEINGSQNSRETVAQLQQEFQRAQVARQGLLERPDPVLGGLGRGSRVYTVANKM